MRVGGRKVAIAAGLMAVAMSAAACGSGDAGASDQRTLTLYNAQHDFVKDMAKDFEKRTGIKVEVRDGKDLELANQIVQEGDRSPADVFVTENSPAMTLVDSKGLFAKIDDATLAQVDAQYVPSDKKWTGFAARSTVLAYNTKNVTPADMPKSLLDLAGPKYKGQVGFAPNGADFQAIVSAVLATKGEAATRTWLAGLKANGVPRDNNVATMKAVNAGELKFGIIYHYYFYKDKAESGANTQDTALHYFSGGDPGAFVSISGAGVLKSSDNASEAQEFVKYLTGPDGQKILGESGSMEYAIGKDAPNDPSLKPLAELAPPKVDAATLNSAKVIELMQGAGFL
jgi:iron(III) transport system substrate-binding protein